MVNQHKEKNSSTISLLTDSYAVVYDTDTVPAHRER